MGIIRFLLALSVVLVHTSPILGISIMGGTMAVQSFFIISGFYMSLILNEKYIGENNSYILFITNRLIRLFPLYWIVLIAVVFSGFLYFLLHHKFTGVLYRYDLYFDKFNLFTFFYLILTNIFLIGQDLLMFLGLNIKNGNFFFTSDFHQTNPALYSFLFVPQAWTIGLEIMFYLIAPFIVRKSTITITGIIAFSLLTRLVLYKNGLSEDPWSYRFFPNEILFFMLGNLSYKIYKELQKISINKTILLSINVLIVLITIFYYKIEFLYSNIIYFIVIFVSIPFIFFYTKKNKLDNQIGELSYPIYISHMFINSILGESSFARFLGKGLTVSFVTVFFSILLTIFVTKPLEAVRQSRLKKYNS